MVNEPKGLWLPREVLIAQEIASSEEPELSMIFEKSPWFDGKLSFTRVRYRNDRGEVIRIVGSWAPASLLPLSALADCDDERVLGLILKHHGNRAAAAYSDEAVDVIQATDTDDILFEFEDGNSFLIHSCALYCNALDESLLCQTVLMTTNHRLFLRRAVGSDMDQPHGSGPGSSGGRT
jgi:hypothetical protein